jgi:FkbH-like protein
LDNTLYRGVLGEDGPAGLEVDADYEKVQEALIDLRGQGLFISVVSRNEIGDVQDLFEQRKDFLLRPEHVDAWAVSWGKKSDGIRDAAEQLRVAPETFLFLDDNPGELLQVQTSIPGIAIGHASTPAMSLQVLTYYPGLFSFDDAGTDSFRAADLASERARAQLRTSSNEVDYLAALEVELDFALDRPSDRARLAQLSSKTNQFNTALTRLDELDIDARMKDPMARIVSIEMSDRLSASGIIGFLAATRDSAGEVTVEDVCVSCRALGRGVEDIMLAEALAKIADELGVARLSIPFTEGPRNGPALQWLNRTAESIADGCAVVRPDNARGISTVKIRWVG